MVNVKWQMVNVIRNNFEFPDKLNQPNKLNELNKPDKQNKLNKLNDQWSIIFLIMIFNI